MMSDILYFIAAMLALMAFVGMAACVYYAWPGPDSDGPWVVGLWIAASQFALVGYALRRRKGDS